MVLASHLFLKEVAEKLPRGCCLTQQFPSMSTIVFIGSCCFLQKSSDFFAASACKIEIAVHNSCHRATSKQKKAQVVLLRMFMALLAIIWLAYGNSSRNNRNLAILTRLLYGVFFKAEHRKWSTSYMEIDLAGSIDQWSQLAQKDYTECALPLIEIKFYSYKPSPDQSKPLPDLFLAVYFLQSSMYLQCLYTYFFNHFSLWVLRMSWMKFLQNTIPYQLRLLLSVEGQSSLSHIPSLHQASETCLNLCVHCM